MLAIGFSGIAVPLVSNIFQFTAILFLAEDEQFLLSTFRAIVIHNEDNRVFADIFEDKIFLIASHSIDCDIQARNPIFFSIDLILIEIFPGLGMIVSGDDSKRFVSDDSSVDASRSTADTSALDAGDTSHDSKSGHGIFFPILSRRIIMDLIHER